MGYSISGLCECRGVQVVVGTPGRVFDMVNRRVLDLAKVLLFVLDEADEMLSRGFRDQVRYPRSP